MELSRPIIRLSFSFGFQGLLYELDQFDQTTWMKRSSSSQGNSAIPFISKNGDDNDELYGNRFMTLRLAQCEYLRKVITSFSDVLSPSRSKRTHQLQ